MYNIMINIESKTYNINYDYDTNEVTFYDVAFKGIRKFLEHHKKPRNDNDVLYLLSRGGLVYNGRYHLFEDAIFKKPFHINELNDATLYFKFSFKLNL